MNPDKTPPPPPGMRILSDEELKNPLPMDAMCILKEDDDEWTPSNFRGTIPDEISQLYCLYATAEGYVPPTDWRKMCEELTTKSADILKSYLVQTRALTGHPCPENMVNCRELSNAITRAKTALEETK